MYHYRTYCLKILIESIPLNFYMFFSWVFKIEFNLFKFIAVFYMNFWYIVFVQRFRNNFYFFFVNLRNRNIILLIFRYSLKLYFILHALIIGYNKIFVIEKKKIIFHNLYKHIVIIIKYKFWQEHNFFLQLIFIVANDYTRRFLFFTLLWRWLLFFIVTNNHFYSFLFSILRH